MADAAPAIAASQGQGRIRRRTGRPEGRGRPPSPLLDLRSELSARSRMLLSALGLAGVLGIWLWTASRGGETGLVPTPMETWRALQTQWTDGTLWSDFTASSTRIAYGYVISMAIGIVLGVLIGSMRSVESVFEAPIGLMRYVPATALTPLLLLWFGIDETPKVLLIVIGTVFFNVLMVADVARTVPREQLEAAYTLGAPRRTVLSRVVLRHSLPGIIDVARINLASGWLMLVVAELLAAQDGLAFRIVRAQRFRQVDTMFALLVVFGVIGVASDLGLRKIRDLSSPWARP
ncbi:MAG: ABC transporter permease [Actinobacteria bacterium]|nr:MAG: ABC transporter permease [Actinomycetota bacterium]